MPKRICTRREVQFDLLKWCKRLGHKCQVCGVRLTHQKCISLCKCYYFCHQKCFIQSYQPQLKDEQIDLKCTQCKQVVKMDLDVTYNYAPSYTILKALKVAIVSALIILILVAIPLTLSVSLTANVRYCLLYAEGLFFCLLTYLQVIYLRDILYTKTVKIKEIISNKLDIQTSAFKELQIYTNQQLTKDYFSHQSKIEKK